MKIVIVGGVAGGATAAARLRRLDEQAEIVLIERGGHISFANCGLPYYIGGDIRGREELTLQTPQSFYERYAVDVRVGQEVTLIDRKNREVEVRRQDGSLYLEPYDKLLLSPGAEPVRPPLPGIDDPRIFTLRTIPDTLIIKDYVERKQPETAVVVGGGFIGLEMAENLARLGFRVNIIERADHILPPFDFDMACELHRHLRERGVELLLETAVRRFAPTDSGVTVLTDSGNIAAGMVIMAVGVRPEGALAKEAGLAVNQRGAILVDDRLRTSDPDIYAVGDAVEVVHFVGRQPVHIPLAGPANKQGRIAADNIRGLDVVYRGTQGSSVLRLFDLTVASTGLNESTVAAAGLDYDKVYTLSMSHASYYPGASAISVKLLFEKAGGRVLGAQLVGEEGVDKRCDVIATAIRAGMTVFDLTELELCYAPPYSSAKDPVNMAGYVAENLLSGRVRQYHWNEVAALPRDGSVTLLDVRTASEYAAGHIPGAVNIPVDRLRGCLHELDCGKPVYVNCRSGQRSYIACRMLRQNGFDCYNLAGGYRLYAMVIDDAAKRKQPLPPAIQNSDRNA